MLEYFAKNKTASAPFSSKLFGKSVLKRVNRLIQTSHSLLCYSSAIIVNEFFILFLSFNFCNRFAALRSLKKPNGHFPRRSMKGALSCFLSYSPSKRLAPWRFVTSGYSSGHTSNQKQVEIKNNKVARGLMINFSTKLMK